MIPTFRCSRSGSDGVNIFQIIRMGKRRPGVAEDLMSSTAAEWKAMLAAPEVYHLI